MKDKRGSMVCEAPGCGQPGHKLRATGLLWQLLSPALEPHLTEAATKKKVLIVGPMCHSHLAKVLAEMLLGLSLVDSVKRPDGTVVETGNAAIRASWTLSQGTLEEELVRILRGRNLDVVRIVAGGRSEFVLPAEFEKAFGMLDGDFYHFIVSKEIRKEAVP